MNCLGGHILTLKIALLNRFGNLVKVHVLAVLFQNDVNLVADVLGVNDGPLHEAPLAVKGRQVLGSAGNSFGVDGILQTGLVSHHGNRLWLAEALNGIDKPLDVLFQRFLVVLLGYGDTVVKVVVVVDDDKPRTQKSQERNTCLVKLRVVFGQLSTQLADTRHMTHLR